MADRIEFSQAVEAAKFISDGKFYVEARVGSANHRNHEYGYKPCRVLLDGSSRNIAADELLRDMASLILSAPAPSCDAFDARSFVEKVIHAICDAYDDDFKVVRSKCRGEIESLTAELTAKFAGRSDDGEAVTEEWMRECGAKRIWPMNLEVGFVSGKLAVSASKDSLVLWRDPQGSCISIRVSDNPTRGDVRRLLAALGITEPAK